MTAFAGIDFDTYAVHVVLIPEDEGPAVYHRYDLPAVGDAFERTREIADVLPPRHGTFWDDVIAVGIEEPQGAQRATVAKLKAVQGAILSCIPRRVVVEPFVPARWRKEVGIPGNASKEAVKSEVITRAWSAGAGMWPQDACDAYCLALAVQKLTTVVTTIEKEPHGNPT